MQFVCIWKRFTAEKTNQYNLYPVGASVYDEPPVETEMVLPPSSLTNGASAERPLWVSCNFRQPLAGVGDLSSSLPSSSSSASASYLWPPSKVNVLPQVQINSTLTDQRPPLLLPLSTSTHTSPTTGEIRASLADLTAPLNTTPDRSLIAGSIHCVPPPPPPPPPSLPLAYLCLWPKAASLLCTHLPLLTHVNAHTHTHKILPPACPEKISN